MEDIKLKKIIPNIFLFAVEKLEQEIKELEEEIEKLKTQKPKMTVGYILNDNEKVFFKVNINCKPSDIHNIFYSQLTSV